MADNKQKLTHVGLAKWIVLNSLYPEFAEQLMQDDMFLLYAWEEYRYEKKEKPDGEIKLTFKWGGEEFIWPPTIGKDGISIGGSGAGQVSPEANRLLKRFSDFIVEFSGKPEFKDNFIIQGEQSFTTKETSLSYQYINKVLTATEDASVNESKKLSTPRKYKDYIIGPKANLWRASLHDADLREANLQQANLLEADLRGADLRGADLQKANLQGADLRGADLQKANLQGADLRGADLQKANLQGADLQKANLQGADLQKANLQGADFRGAVLQRANLIEAYFLGAILVGANLQGANLQQANLRNVDLRGANLRNVNLRGAYITGADLQETYLQEADLEKANFIGAKFSHDMIKTAKNWEKAIYDDDQKRLLGLK